ncbi:MAG: nucleoside triphosphate pyrophosphohydrolase [Candidatus Krumholzibacteria bacterium]|nr:nucleoside triphosphate pyrophosphohydrolase [Candidatus Krumholzibacteria bacterium]
MPSHFEELLATIRTLRAPGGCPWDRKQTLHNAARYLMDEAGELVDATLDEDIEGSREELADLLFMTCFCTEILGETEKVTMQDIAREGNAKLIRRHPHVFGDTEARTTAESQEQWNAIKREEKRAKGIDPDRESSLKDMPSSTAPLHQAYTYQKDAADHGFDWPDVNGVWAKLDEELTEFKDAVEDGKPAAIQHELGDLLFSIVNLARWHKIQPDMALRQANNRFRDRFHLVEEDFKSRGVDMKDAGIDALEASWQDAKRRLS